MKKCPKSLLNISLIALIGISQLGCTKLSPLAEQMMKQAEQRRENATEDEKQSYYFRLGLPYVTNPIAIGKHIFEQSQQNHQSPKIDVAKFRYPSDTALICKFSQKDCLNQISNYAKTPNPTSKTADDNDFILNRYYEFLQNPPAITLMTDMANDPYPDYRYIILGQRLAFLQNVRLANDKKADEALQYSLLELEKLRKLFPYSDTLVDKMIINHLIISELQQIIYLKQHYAIHTDVQIKPLTDEEKNMGLVFRNEFAWSNAVLKSTNNELNVFEKLLFDYNDTMNAWADFVNEQINISQLSPSDFAKHQIASKQNPNPSLPIKTNHTNPIGRALANTAMIDYQVYTERVLSLNNLINITNFVLSNEKTPLKNTFSPTVTSVTQKDDEICVLPPTLDLTKENLRQYRCMWIGFEPKS